MIVVQVSSSLSRSMTFEGHVNIFHCPVVGLLQSMLSLLSPVWCHPPASITLISFQPLISLLKTTCAVLLPYFCCSALVPPSSGSVFVVIFLMWFQGMQPHLSCTSSPTGSTPGAEPTAHSPACSRIWVFHCPFSPQSYFSVPGSPSCVTGLSLCPSPPIRWCHPNTSFALMPQPDFLKQMSHGFMGTSRACMAGEVHLQVSREEQRNVL